MELLAEIIKLIIVSGFLGGGLWKGLEAIANALSKRAAAVNLDERLDFDQRQANYSNAMSLIDKQAKRIDVLTVSNERNENKIKELSDLIEKRQKDQGAKEVAYAEEIKELKIEVEHLQQENKKLKSELDKTISELEQTRADYCEALERIVALEKGDTGPLKEP